MSKKAILTIGCSASGKSTWASTFHRTPTELWERIERDVIRRQAIYHFLQDDSRNHEEFNYWVNTQNFWNLYNFKKMESWVQERYEEEINDCIQLGLNIIISDTNLNKTHRESLIKKLEGFGYEVELKFFNVEYKILIERDSKRRDTVGQQVIAKQYFDFMNQFGADFGFHPVVKDVTKPDAILVDIDGTLAHMNRGRSPYDWDKVEQDQIDILMREIVNSFEERGFVIIIMSGRDAVCREQTIRWLEANDVAYDHLYMRPEGDTRSDVIIKNEIVQEHINGNFNVEAWFDDRPCVVRLAHVLGVKSVAMGNQHLEF